MRLLHVAMFGPQKIYSFHVTTLTVSQYNFLVAINLMNSLGVLVLYLGIAAAHNKLSIAKFPLTSPEQCTSEHLHYSCCWIRRIMSRDIFWIMALINPFLQVFIESYQERAI